MDLIYTNADKLEQGVLINYSLDLEESVEKDKCTLEIQTTIQDSVLDIGSFVYISNTEYGGKIDSLKIDTKTNIVYASGRTWRGILGSKVIEPPLGEAYYVASGDIREVLEDILYAIELNDLFTVECKEPLAVNYKFNRYTDAYTGLLKLATQYGYKLVLNFDITKHKVVVSLEHIVNYSNESELTSDMFEFKLEKGIPAVNHMIGLGKGELEERMIVHKFLDADGKPSDTQYYIGDEEITGVYDYPNVESEEELAEKTAEALEAGCIADKMEITAYDLSADLGDEFTATDIKTGISMSQYVTTKIVTINHEIVKFQYKVGEALL